MLTHTNAKPMTSTGQREDCRSAPKRYEQRYEEADEANESWVLLDAAKAFHAPESICSSVIGKG
jgi:hypothetical protein